MISSLKKIRSKTSKDMSADVIDGYLVLSLLNAQEPKIWRMAVDKIGAATFELKTNEKDDNTKFILKPKKGTAEIIASFDNKDEALNALTLASNALRHKPAQTEKIIKEKVTPKSQHSLETKKSSSKWSILGIGALIVIALYIYLTVALMPQPLIELDTSGTSTQGGQTNNETQTGVPLSADDFLSGM